jgi:uncharacterized SAM-binding protein YcdF (DUF218 family)
MFWVCILFAWAAITKKTRRKKRLFYTSAIVFYTFSNSFLINQFARLWDVQSQNTGNTHYSCAIVLGGFTSVDADGNGYFNGSATRYIEAVKLKTIGKVDKLLITGGSGLLFKGHDFREADYVGQQLHILHIPDSAVLTESRSRNTIENAVYSKKILADNKIKGPYLLITSAFHMRRALYTFKKSGLDVIPYSCDYVAGKGGFSVGDLIPDAVALAEWNTYTKELVGYITYHFKSF